MTASRFQAAHDHLNAGRPADALAAVRAQLDHPRAVEPDLLAEGLGVLARIAVALGQTEVAARAAHTSLEPADVDGLYDLGYHLIEAGLPALAATVLTHALALAPGVAAIVTELCAALERALAYADARALLERHPGLCETQFLCRYLLAYNAIMSGDLTTPRRIAPTLVPEEPDHEVMAARIVAMLTRAERVTAVTALDRVDLRGWHWVTTGGLLLHRSPYGLDTPMHGRYAWLQDSYGRIAATIEHLTRVLATWAWRPPCVFAVPGREHEAVARAVAARLDVAIAPWPMVGAPAPGLVVAHALEELTAADVVRLRERRRDQVWYVHAARWTEDFSIAPDVVGLVRQSSIPPWGARLAVAADGAATRSPPDDGDAAALAAHLTAATPELDPEPEYAASLALARTVGPPAAGLRERWWAGGPVPSNRFGS